MEILLILITIIFLTGCSSNHSVTGVDTKNAVKLCNQNDGLEIIKSYGTTLKVYCNNGATFKIRSNNK